MPKPATANLGAANPKSSTRAPANYLCFDAAARIHALPRAVAQSTQERNYIRTDVVLAKKLKWPLSRRLAFMNESTDALLPGCHSLSMSIRCRRVAERPHNFVFFSAAGSLYAFHGRGRSAGLLCNQPILFFNDGARGGVAVKASKDFGWHSAIGALRTVFVDDIE